MIRPLAGCLALALLFCGVRAEPSSISVFGSAPLLQSGVQDQPVPAAQALEELFSTVAGLEGRPAEQALAGLLAAAAPPAGEQGGRPVDAVVVLASGADATLPAVQQKLLALAGAAAGSVSLPHAEHEGASHPVFAGLRAASSRLTVRVLGACGGAVLPSAAPATAEGLRQQLAEAVAQEGSQGETKLPAVLVVCPPSEGDADGSGEAALLEAASAAASELAPRHLIVHVAHPAARLAREQRRRLAAVAAVAAVSKKGDAANRTKNYTYCDATCHKHVMWFEGLIVFIVVLSALVVGCCCMHLIDVPTRFAQPEQSRPHGD